MNQPTDRREFLKSAGAAVAVAASFHTLPAARGAAAAPVAASSLDDPAPAPQNRGRIFKSIKMGMFNEAIPLVEKFRLLRDMGYDGIELNSPGGEDKEEALRASREVGLPIHGVVDSIHWQDRLSDPDAEVRARGLRGLLTAIEETRYVGGATVLLVPGRNADPETENQQHVWDRSIEAIRTALPLAAKNGVRILIENVWNGFLYDHEGSADQSADRLAAYIDAIHSPWVGVYFDIGNHRKYGRPEEWIRTLGSRIVKLDVKDWGRENGWAKIGDGDVDWKQVRAALADIGFSGWATAEVNGGDRERIQEIAERMNEALAL